MLPRPLPQNGSCAPVNYTLPPGIRREISIATTNLQQLNEQSMSLRVCGLKDGSAKAAYTNLDLDVLNYGKLKMYVHCESADEDNLLELEDDCLSIFGRLGTDIEHSFDPDTASGKEGVFRPENNTDIDFARGADPAA